MYQYDNMFGIKFVTRFSHSETYNT